MSAGDPRPADFRRSVKVEQIMGTAVSIHVITAAESVAGESVAAAMGRVGARLHQVDRVCSPFLESSDICLIARGDLGLADADPMIAEIHRECLDARARTGGLFDPWWKGWFDPTGIVKGWAVERVVEQELAPLLEIRDVAAVGVNAGGDMQLLTAEDSPWVWEVGIVDPNDPRQMAARLSVTSGAIATSGIAERGDHIIDPRTGGAAHGIASSTVVADRLTEADLWATTAMIAGFDDLDWIATAGTRAGLLIASDGRVRRWSGGTRILADGAGLERFGRLPQAASA